ncbi:organic solute transporter Ostalpha-domain-containing protein [Talaromyces proteolyticus]|uniref:Organic solute transporter Ostalpha-domain-containing protein n=1 Tax=Talaromyces proteolyticus TaxID=1131652 RepID=A0AAD4PWM2_9EURO|nr:organic solute transporter Ostalpha-domain-containing protein [Talaromyces proteolyticus]KAH8692142.1 organic solute transporter Ostalpha-domain-containing protein [Talaromyces proteolyticus]
MPSCDSSAVDGTISETRLWEGGWMFHNLAIILCAIFTLIAFIIAGILIIGHATHYSRPSEQRYILRILFMIPIYSLTSFLCVAFYKKTVIFQLIGNCYEPFTIASFFALLCNYIVPDLHDQKEYFRHIKPVNWVWPVTWFQKFTGGQNGIWRQPRSGLTWFNVIWIGVFHYCFIRVVMTVIAVVAESTNVYCETSISPVFAHFWVLLIESIAVSIAMYCLIQFYIQIKGDIAQHKPFLKIVCIKLVIFLSFWQSTIIDLLTSSGLVKGSDKIALQDWNNALPNLLICMEMATFAVLHLWGFPWRHYVINMQKDGNIRERIQEYHGGRLGTAAIMDAMNPWDLCKAIARGLRWLFVGRKQRMLDQSYQLAANRGSQEHHEYHHLPETV